MLSITMLTGVSGCLLRVFIFALYFIPYALIVGQLGSTFKEGKGGVSTGLSIRWGRGWLTLRHGPIGSCIFPTGAKAAGDTHCIGMGFKRRRLVDKRIYRRCLAGLTLALFVFFMWVASVGMKSLKVVGSVAGIAMFIMSILYVVMAVTAPAITNVEIATTNITRQSFIPHIDFTYITTISMLVFAVGGAEKISPYVNQTRNPEKNFRRGCSFSRHGCGLRYPRFVGDGNDV